MAVRHIGLICPEISGHLNPMTTLGRELLTNDQPGVGARLAWLGAGQIVPLKGLNADRLRKAVQQVLTEPRFRERAVEIQHQIYALDGVRRAADIAEEALNTRQPVLRT